MGKTKPRIAVIASFVALPGEKGLGRLYYLADYFCKNGFDVDLITGSFQHWSKSQRVIETVKETESSVKVIILPQPSYEKNVQLKRIKSLRMLCRRILEFLRNTQPYNLIYCMIPDNHIGAATAAYAKQNGVPFIVDVEDLWPKAMRMVLDIPIISDLLFCTFDTAAKQCYKLSDALIASSDTYRDYHQQYGIDIKDKITVYVGNDLQVFDDGVLKFGAEVTKPEDEFWVMYAGTIGTSYDILTLIKATEESCLKNRNIRIMILGDGPMRAECESLAQNLSTNRVSFLGYQQYSMMAAYLSKADVTVNSVVRKAPQSIVSKIGDYLAAGKPMINTCIDAEFWKKVENDGFGVNVEPGDPLALAQAIEQLISSPAEREMMGKNARRLAETQFDRATSYNSIVDLVNRTMKEV